jgi:hypothetical protein
MEMEMENIILLDGTINEEDIQTTQFTQMIP